VTAGNPELADIPVSTSRGECVSPQCFAVYVRVLSAILKQGSRIACALV